MSLSARERFSTGMRIEKVNDSQIRCYLSREDMESRQLHLKELAYGTEKARRLFHELMQEAYKRYGFEAENIPVMVEAVPLHDDSLVLIVTKVDNPEELDTRFSSFASPGKKKSAGSRPSSEKAGNILPAGAQLYTFTSLGQAADAACLTASVFDGKSALYRDPADAKYYLFLTPSEDTDSAKYTRTLSAFSEFGTSETITPAREQYLLEHCEVICAQNAVQSLARLGR